MAEPEATGEKRERPVRWIGRSRGDLREFPGDARRDIGYALSFAQSGEKHPLAKPLKGFKGAGVLERTEDHRGDTYRAMHTVRFAAFVYVLHAFMKKSKSCVKTPQHEIELIEQRLKPAEADYRQWQQENGDDT